MQLQTLEFVFCIQMIPIWCPAGEKEHIYCMLTVFLLKQQLKPPFYFLWFSLIWRSRGYQTILHSSQMDLRVVYILDWSHTILWVTPQTGSRPEMKHDDQTGPVHTVSSAFHTGGASRFQMSGFSCATYILIMYCPTCALLCILYSLYYAVIHDFTCNNEAL